MTLKTMTLRGKIPPTGIIFITINLEIVPLDRFDEVSFAKLDEKRRPIPKDAEVENPLWGIIAKRTKILDNGRPAAVIKHLAVSHEHMELYRVQKEIVEMICNGHRIIRMGEALLAADDREQKRNKGGGNGHR